MIKIRVNYPTLLPFAYHLHNFASLAPFPLWKCVYCTTPQRGTDSTEPIANGSPIDIQDYTSTDTPRPPAAYLVTSAKLGQLHMANIFFQSFIANILQLGNFS